MARRRAKGEGSIYYSQNQNLWVAQFTLPDGSRKTKYSKTQREAKDWLLLKRRELSEGIFTDSTKITVSEFLDRWYEDIAKPKLRPSTLAVHETMIRVHIKPAIGYIRLSQLAPIHLQNFYSQKLKDIVSFCYPWM